MAGIRWVVVSGDPILTSAMFVRASRDSCAVGAFAVDMVEVVEVLIGVVVVVVVVVLLLFCCFVVALLGWFGGALFVSW